MHTNSRGRAGRRGVTTVEFAMIAGPLFLFILGNIEFGRALMAVNCLEEAARSGARVAILRGATVSEIEAEVDRILRPAGITKRTVQIDPTNYSTLDRWQPISITVSATFNDMSWLPLPRFVGGKTYASSCSLPKEYEDAT